VGTPMWLAHCTTIMVFREPGKNASARGAGGVARPRLANKQEPILVVGHLARAADGEIRYDADGALFAMGSYATEVDDVLQERRGGACWGRLSPHDRDSPHGVGLIRYSLLGAMH
jgi:hypothetical protein